MYPIDVNDIQRDWYEWARKQFPTQTTESILNHLKSEIQELMRSPADEMEYADCIMLLLNAANVNGIRAGDILRASEDKLAINKKRKWGVPNEKGFVEHIEE